MKHLLHKLSSLRLLMLLAVLLGVSGAVWADEAYYTLDTTNDANKTGNNGYGSSGTATVGGIEWTFEGNGTMNPWRLGGKNITDQDRAVYTNTPMGAAISSINLRVGAASSITVNSLRLVVASDASFANVLDAVTGTFAANSTITFEPTSASSWDEDSYYKFIFNVSVSGNTNRFVEFSKVEFYAYSSLQDCDLALTGAPVALNFDLYNSSAAQTVTFTTSSTGNVTVSGGEGYVTTAVSGNTITVTPTAVTPSAQTIIVSQAADDNYKAGQVTFTVFIDDSTPLPTHTATFSINGTTSSQDFEEGAAIVFPSDPADISDKTFVGWVTDAISGVTDVEPSFVTSETMGYSDVTYYAVFADVTAGTQTTITDNLTSSTFGSPSSYTTWSGKSATNGSDAVYAGNSTTKSYDTAIQIRATSPSGIVSTTSGGKIKKVTVTWNAGTTAGRTLDVYGKNTAYTASENLYGTATAPGTKIGSIVYGTSTELTIDGDYEYIGMRSSGGAMYLDQISIEWSTGTPDTYSSYCTTVVAAAVERPTIKVAANPFVISTTATISCETEGAAIKYSYDNENWNDYTEALTITETTTIYAKAVKDADESTVASVEITKNLAVPTVTINAEGITNTNVFTSTEAGSLAAAVTYNDAAVEGAVVTWSGNNDAVATIDASTGAVTLVAAGTVTFTATYAGNSDYSEKTATYVMTVTNTDPNAPGTENNPYTVAQALAADPATGVYVRGTISAITEVSTSYHNATYTITDGENTMTVYRGRFLNNEDFTSADQISVGDLVVVFGNLSLYNEKNQLSQGNYLVSLTRKADSDFAISSETNVELEITSAELHPTSQITYTSSSTGDVIFVSNDDAIVTVSDEGIITAQGEGTTTITVMQEGDSNYKASAEMTIEVTVSDNRSAVATDIDLPAAQKTLVVGDMDDFTATGTVEAGFTGTVVYTYETSDASIVDVDEGTFSAEAPGTADITITATPTDGNAANYKSASQVVTVTVKGTTTLELSDTEDIETFGTPIVFTATIADGYDGVLLTESSNDLVATAAIEGTTITVTSHAVGTAVITVTAPETEVFAGEVSKYFSVEFAQPAGLTEAPASGFAKVTATENITDGEYLIVYEDANVAFDGSLETLDATDNTIEVEINDGVIAATNTTTAATFTIDTTAGTLQSMSGYYIGKTANSNGLDSNTETQYTNTFEIDGAGNAVITASGGCVLKYNSASNQNRFRYYKSGQQDIQLYKFADASATVTINKYGYATYCSVNPMDFSSTEGYTAWRVNSISNDGIITYKKITTAIKGGQGVLLYNKDADDENTTKVTVTFADGDTEFDNGSDGNDENDNLLIGTTALTYVAEASVYGLYGSSFVKSSEAGLIPAGKAYIEATEIPAGVKNFTFVFEDETTGITETRQATREEVESIFNLGGQRMSKLQRGINIVNGRKVLVK